MRTVLSSRRLLKALRDHHVYLRGARKAPRSAKFEQLVLRAFAELLHLPFRDVDDGDSPPNVVKWFGSQECRTTARGNGPDGVATAYGFCLSIEATQQTGARQCSMECSQALRHARRYAHSNELDPGDMGCILVAGTLHEDTHSFCRTSNAREPIKILPLELRIIAEMVETSILAFTVRNADVRNLFTKALGALDESSSLDAYRGIVERQTRLWQGEVLDLGKNTIVAVRSYEAIRRIGRPQVGESEILGRLLHHPTLKRYFTKLGRKLDPEMIERGLLDEGLAIATRLVPTGERIYWAVPLEDFKSRCARRTLALEECC